jgi:hypothetical protein
MNLASDEYFNKIMEARRRFGIKGEDEGKARRDLETRIKVSLDVLKESGYGADFLSQALDPKNIDKLMALEPDKFSELKKEGEGGKKS